MKPVLPTELQTKLAREVLALDEQMREWRDADEKAKREGNVTEAKRLGKLLHDGYQKLSALRQAQAVEQDRVNREWRG